MASNLIIVIKQFYPIKSKNMKTNLQYINPAGLSRNPAYSQAVMTPANGQHVYIGGQNAVNHNHEVIGKGDIGAQTEQVMLNIQTALSACGASFDNLLKLSIYIVQGQNLQQAFQASQKFMSKASHPPAVSGMFVAGLAHPDFLIEVDAIAFLPA